MRAVLAAVLLAGCANSSTPATTTVTTDAGACHCRSGVCCAEEATSNPGHILTSCRASCITDVPRAKVCSAATDCEPSQTCKAYDCADLSYDGLKTCSPIRACN